MDILTWAKQNTTILRGKRIAVSGATGGIGRELCLLLAGLEADLILLDRDQTRSAALEEALCRQFPDRCVRRIPLDLANPVSVRDAATELLRLPLDGLILNAGIYQVPRYQCETGLDNVFQVNFLSPYYLAKTLRGHLLSRGGKVVAVGSIAHTNAHTDPGDVDFSRRSKSSLVYGNSKRFLMYALYELFDGGPGLAVAHPGITLTKISAHHPPALFRLMKPVMKVIFMPPKKACLSIAAGLFEDCGRNEWIGPKWFDLWGRPKKRTLHSVSPEESKWVGQTAEELYAQMARIWPVENFKYE